MASLFRRSPRAVVASAAKLKRDSGNFIKITPENWQTSALDFYESIGELRYAGQFYARQLSRVKFHPARLKPDGSVVRIESGLPVELLNRIQDPAGGRSRLQYDYGRLMFVTGEGVLFGDRLDTEMERWRFLWRGEVEFSDSGAQVVRLDTNGMKTDEVGVGYRMWTPSPRHSDRADSPMRAILDIASELQILTASVRGTAVTRLTKGILKAPLEAMPQTPEPDGDEDAENNPFLRQMIEHLQAQIENPADAASMVPFIWAAGYDYLDGIEWLKIHDPATDYLERDLRVEAVKRLALGLDMPPEVLLGMTDANHWTAKQVQHDMWKSHGIPKAEQFADDLNEAYLRPALLDAGFAGAEEVVVSYDDSEVVASPDRAADALEVFKVGGLSYKALREKTGFTEADAPSDDELATIAAIITRNAQLIQDEFDVEPAPAPGIPGPVPNESAPRDPSNGPPNPSGGRSVSRQEARTASIMGAAAMALRNCRSKAGARLRGGLEDKCPECHQRTDSLPNSVVASALGPDVLAELERRNPLTLVKGGTDEFRGILEEWGIDKAQAEGACQRLEAYAAATLFEERQPELPPGFLAYIEDVKGEDDTALAHRE